MTTKQTNPLILNPEDEFESILVEAVKMRRKKAAVYGTDGDELQNFIDGAYMNNTTSLRQCEALMSKHGAAIKQWFGREPRADTNPVPTRTSDDGYIDRVVYSILAHMLYNRMKG